MIYEQFCTITEDGGRPVSVDYHYPQCFNFAYDVVDQVAVKTPEKTALVWCSDRGEERTFTFRDIKEMSIRYAKVLISSGISKGDKVIVSLRRHYEYWITAVALERIGAVMIPVTSMLTAEDFAYRISASDAKAVIVTPFDNVPENIRKAKAITDRELSLWTIADGVEGFDNLPAEAEMQTPIMERIDTSAEDAMLMYFTSGTTGRPKGVIHDHTYALSHIITAKYWQGAFDGGLHFTLAETGWAKASWGKLYGQWLVGSAVMVYDFTSFDPGQLATIINRYGVTSFCAPPTVYRYLVRKGFTEMPTLRSATTAGEYLSPDIFRAFREKTGITLREGYGQTETALIAANFTDDKAVDGSMGKPSPLYTVRILRPDGSEASPGEKGEIAIEAENGKKPIGVFSSYLDDGELYEKAWRDGLYHTGDEASMDENGSIWFFGRIDDVIKSSGFRIGPGEIEYIVSKYPAVEECSVVGIPDALRGQKIKAFIKLHQGVRPSRELEKTIRDFCNSQLAEYKWIRSIGFVDNFQKTISGKIIKHLLIT